MPMIWLLFPLMLSTKIFIVYSVVMDIIMVYFIRPLIDFFSIFPVVSTTSMSLYSLLKIYLGYVINMFSLNKLKFICLLSPMFFNQNTDLSHGSWQGEIFDVGQGLAVLIKTRSHYLLYDTGTGGKYMTDSGKNIILPYLNKNGIGKINDVIISHTDMDHVGGFNTINEKIQFDNLYTSNPSYFKGKVDLCISGHKWSYDGVDFEFIHPDILFLSKAKKNDKSCVLRVKGKYHSFLIPGDIENTAEKHIVETGVDLQSDILLAAHHGSNTSSSFDFIQSVNASYIIFSTGKDNRYSFPSDKVEKRLNCGEISSCYYTAKNGNVKIRSSFQGLQLATYDNYWLWHTFIYY